MSYLALYRKYRSRTFDELAGQQFIVKTLQNSLKNGDISHAYLFCGPRGTGKTSMARLFAKALNCEEGVGHICNKCDNCEAINAGSHPDIIEIDAASNSSVEQIRTLIEKVKYAPIKGKYKVYIIDEVHMLSNSAFNALLKTLEEPPSDVVFILATTEPHKILPTIISRCQRYDFAKISDNDIKSHLLDIMNKENISCDVDALDEIVKLSDGCMRDALSILDQLVAFTNKHIQYDDLLKVFGLVSLSNQKDFLKNIFLGRVENVLLQYHYYAQNGADIIRFNQSLIDILKDVLIFKATNNRELLQKLPLDYVVELNSICDYKYINELINLFMQANLDLKTVSNITSAYEITLIKAVSIQNSMRPDDIEEEKIVENVKKPAEPQQNEVFEDVKEPIIEEKLEEKGIEEPVAEEIAVSVEEPIVQQEEIVEPVKEEIIAQKEPEIQKTQQNSTIFASSENEYVEQSVEDLPFMKDSLELEEAPKEEQKVDNLEVKNDVKEQEVAPEQPQKGPQIKTYEDFISNMSSKDDGKFKETSKEKKDAKNITTLNLTEDFLIKAIVKSTKQEKIDLTNKWHNLANFMSNSQYANFANLLMNCSVFTACDELIILQTQFKTIVARLNSIKDNNQVNELVSNLVGHPIHVYVIDYSQANELQHTFYNLKSVGKLPNKSEIGKLYQ